MSADGSTVVFQAMPREDWELFVVGADGGAPRRLTHEIQHDIDPQFVGPRSDLILAVMGEGRHRRSYLYDAASGARTRLFHNNTVRTVAPEYEWAVRPDGRRGRDRERSRRRHRLARAGRLSHRPGAHGGHRGAARAGPHRGPHGARAPGAGHGDVRAHRGGGPGRGARGLLGPDLSLRVHPLDLRLPLHHPARQRQGDRVSADHAPELGLRAGAPVVRAPARRALGQRGRHPARHHRPGPGVRGRRPLRFGRGRARRGRQRLGDDPAARGRPGAGPAASAGHDQVRLVHRRRRRGSGAAGSSSAERWKPRSGCAARSTTTCSAG